MSSALSDLPLQTRDQAFESGMKAAAPSLHDPLQNGSQSEPAYESTFLAPQNIHGVILAAGSDDSTCSQKLQKIMGMFGSSASEVNRISGKVRPGAMKGHEQYGQPRPLALRLH